MSGVPSRWDSRGGGPSSPGDPRSILLEPRAAAAGQARRWIATALAHWPTLAVETAQLLLSEVVTNAVLHARTAIDVRVHPAGEGIRVEVADGLASGPLPKYYEADAATGRGLHLLAGLAQEWGVTRADDGKVVWFTLAPSSGAGAHPGGGRAGATTTELLDLDAWAQLGEDASPAPSPAAARRLVEVHIDRLPLAVYLETEEHNDALLREFTLILESAGRGPSHHAVAEVPRRLVELADEVRTIFGTATTGLRSQVEQALRRGGSTVDLVVAIPATGWERLLQLAAHLDEADRYCEEGELLTLASSPAVRRFRRWYTEEVAAQLRGRPAAPWPYGTGGQPPR